MKYAYKTEIKPTNEQARKIRRSIGICRWLYNEYLEVNKRLYQMYRRGLLDSNQPYFMTANDFDKYVNNKLKTKPKYAWINKCASKARKKILMNAESAFRSFFAGNTAFPSFKKKMDEDIKLYFPKNNPTDWLIERHRIKIPTLKYVRLKEYGYLPTGAKIINGTVSQTAGRFYVSVTVEETISNYKSSYGGIGIAVKINSLDKLDEEKFPRLAVWQKRLQRARQKLSRKYSADNISGYCNKEKQRLKVKKLQQKIEWIKKDYLDKCVAEIMKQQPQYITIENLDIKSMALDKDMKKITAKQKYYDFKNRLLLKCAKYDIELKQADKLDEEKIIFVELI
ncbi:transposase [Megamonas hypermegale]|uniref:RNA-guided endonuclease InsQ/TnpB family protein n=2 Tax=Megamonas hypermegale TaxID=158847 RepID=UPI0026EE0377|nr:transposase [Megamonas hypermegale]